MSYPMFPQTDIVWKRDQYGNMHPGVMRPVFQNPLLVHQGVVIGELTRPTSKYSQAHPNTTNSYNPTTYNLHPSGNLPSFFGSLPRDPYSRNIFLSRS